MEMKLLMFGSNRKESRIIESQNPVDCCAVEMELNPINKVMNSIFMVLFFDKSKGFTSAFMHTFSTIPCTIALIA